MKIEKIFLFLLAIMVSGCAASVRTDFRDGEIDATRKAIFEARNQVLYRTKTLTPELAQSLSSARQNGRSVTLIFSSLSEENENKLSSCVNKIKSHNWIVSAGSPTLILDDKVLYKNGYFIARETKQIYEELEFFKSLVISK